jgi:serine/threonine protein kinase
MDREGTNPDRNGATAFHEAETRAGFVRPEAGAPGSAGPDPAFSAGTHPSSGERSSFPVPGWDRYEHLGFLGEGGMGRVFSARDPRLGRDVALKFIKGEDPELARRFLVEARAQARVEHPAVCPVWEVGEVEGHLYIAMPLLRGPGLRDAARRMTLEQKVEVVARVAEGLHAAHRIGLVHRDVKPGNILVETTPEGEHRPYVMDFGLVRDSSVEGMTVTGLALGTPWYMPPEQALGRHGSVDRRSDVYSLGVSLYEILAGALPFDGGTPFDVMNRVLTEEPAPIARSAPGFPRDLDTIVLKCLEKDPARRYDSARALAEDLRRFLDGDPIAARPDGIATRFTRRVRKNPALAAMAAGLLLALISFGLFAVRSRLEAARRSEIARGLGEEIRETEVLIRFASHMLPLHDVNRERAVVRHRMRDLEARLPASSASWTPPGRGSNGRGTSACGHPTSPTLSASRSRTSTSASAAPSSPRRRRTSARGVAGRSTPPCATLRSGSSRRPAEPGWTPPPSPRRSWRSSRTTSTARSGWRSRPRIRLRGSTRRGRSSGAPSGAVASNGWMPAATPRRSQTSTPPRPRTVPPRTSPAATRRPTRGSARCGVTGSTPLRSDAGRWPRSSSWRRNGASVP